MLVLSGMMILSNGLSVSASSILDEVQPTETDANHAEDISYSLLRGSNLNLGMGDIEVLSSNEINITGITQCHRICDKVYLDIYLEQKTDVGYSTYKYWEYSKTNGSNLTVSLDVIVPRGHYYRVRGYHAAEKGGVYESTTTLTSGVWVN